MSIYPLRVREMRRDVHRHGLVQASSDATLHDFGELPTTAEAA